MTKKKTARKRQAKAKLPFGVVWWPSRCPRPGDPRFEKLPWPANVPVLVAEDVCRNHTYPLTQPPYNLDGWLEAIFNPELSSKREVVWVEHVAGACLEAVIRDRTAEQLAVWEYAHVKGVTREMLASAWNEAMALLSYDIAHPSQTGRLAKADYSEFFE